MCPREYYLMMHVQERGYALTDRKLVDREWAEGLEEHVRSLGVEI
jgi:hypothetical protein